MEFPSVQCADMFGVLRRRVASGSSPTSTARHLLQKIRAGVHGPSASLIGEESIFLMGNRSVGDIRYLVSLGHASASALKPNSVALINPSLDVLQYWRSFSSNSDAAAGATLFFSFRQQRAAAV